MQSHAKGSPPEMVGIFVTCDVGFAICTGVPVDGLGDGSLVLLVDGADDVEGASVGERLGAFVRVGSLDGDSLGGCDAVGTPGIVRTGSLHLLLQYLVNWVHPILQDPDEKSSNSKHSSALTGQSKLDNPPYSPTVTWLHSASFSDCVMFPNSE
jgi:hypothetical protein